MILPAFFVENGWALLFYAVVILIIVLLRKKIEWQVFGIGLYKTKAGLKLMEKLGTKYRGLVQLLGYVGVGVGFLAVSFPLEHESEKQEADAGPRWGLLVILRVHLVQKRTREEKNKEGSAPRLLS